jgi:hypothetical protein
MYLIILPGKVNFGSINSAVEEIHLLIVICLFSIDFLNSYEKNYTLKRQIFKVTLYKKLLHCKNQLSSFSTVRLAFVR